MNKKNWTLTTPIDAIIFDCDSTLSQIEGIDALAELNNVLPAVHALTEKAMAETGLNETLYKERLDLVQPNAQQVASIADLYEEQITPDVAQVIEIFQSLGKSVYVISAGVLQSVVGFAEKLHIPRDHVFAVEVYFNEDGSYKNFDRKSPLIAQQGKPKIIEQLREKHRYFAHVGDGMNDVEVAGTVDRFIGYGGSEYRENIASLSDFYVCSISMFPVLPLLLTENEAKSLQGESVLHYQKGLQLIKAGEVELNHSL